MSEPFKHRKSMPTDLYGTLSKGRKSKAENQKAENHLAEII